MIALIIGQIASVKYAEAISNQHWDINDTYRGGTYDPIEGTGAGQGTDPIRLVVGQTQFVQDTRVIARVYVTKQQDFNVTIYGINFCPSQQGNPDAFQNGDWYTSHHPSSGASITDFHIGEKTVDGKYYPGGPSECNLNKTVPVSGSQLSKDDETKYWYADIYVLRNYSIPPLVPDGQYQGIMNYFFLSTDGPGGRITQQAFGGDENYPTDTFERVGDIGDPNNSGSFNDYVIRFGSDCTVTSSKKAILQSYDLDPGGGSGAQKGRLITQSLVKIDNTTGKRTWVKDENGRIIRDLRVEDSRSPIKLTTQVIFYAEPDFSYEWVLSNVYDNNTIQIAAPFDGIFYRQSLCPSPDTKVYPESRIDGLNPNNQTFVNDPPNQVRQHTFEHYVNVNPYKDGKNGSVDWVIQTSNNGQTPTGTRGSSYEVVNKKQLAGVDASATVDSSYTYTPPNNQNGVYCERLHIYNNKPPADVKIKTADSNWVCVNYQNEPGGTNNNRYIDFTAQGGGAVRDEPEVVASINSQSMYGTVSSRPQTNELGYNQQNVQLAPTRIYETQTAIDTFKDGQSRDVHLTGNPANDGTCSHLGSNYYRSGPICRWDYTEYHYICSVPGYGNQEGGWARDGISQPGCNYAYYHECPDGTPARYGLSNNAQPCNDAWRCAYGQVWTNVGQPACEYRCDGGGGARAVLATDPSPELGSRQYFDTYRGPDRSCYKPWQVRVTCQLTYTKTGGQWQGNAASQTWLETVTANPDGTVSNYCNNPPGGYPTGYEYGDIGTQGCMTLKVVSVTGFDNNGSSILPPNVRMVSNNLVWGTRATGNTAEQCWISIGRPFVQFNNTDISTMGCGIGSGNVTLYANNDYGSSVEYAAYAAGAINSLRNNYNNGSQGLAFASDGNKTINGGDFANKSSLPCDYYTSLQNNAQTGDVTSKIHEYPGQSIEINQAIINSLMPTTGSYAIFADNITITSDINLPFVLKNDPGNPNDTGQKVLFLVAKSAINIQSNVSHIDASLISNNTINTCTGSPNDCERSLTINGGMGASKIEFRRTGVSSLYCARPDRGSTCEKYKYPAELINYGEYYEMFSPPFRPVGGVDVGKYDSIRSLAPIF